MTDEELVELEEQLRDIAAEAGLGWAIEQADEWLAEGQAKEVSPAPRYNSSWDYRQGRYESEGVKGWTSPKRFLTYPDVTRQDRIIVLIEALARVITELPVVERAMLANFTPSTNLRMAPVASVTFTADSDQPAHQDHVMSTDVTPEATDVGSEAADLLSQLRVLVVER